MGTREMRRVHKEGGSDFNIHLVDVDVHLVLYGARRSSLFQYVSRTTQTLLKKKKVLDSNLLPIKKIRLSLCVPYEKIRN